MSSVSTRYVQQCNELNKEPHISAQNTIGELDDKISNAKIHVTKLTEEYNQKIIQADIIIANLDIIITTARHHNTICHIERTERSVWNAKKQVYIQSRVDIETMLDYL